LAKKSSPVSSPEPEPNLIDLFARPLHHAAYRPDMERALVWNDLELAIDW
jgi:hypothetical protein